MKTAPFHQNAFGFAVAILTGLALVAIVYFWPSKPKVLQPDPAFEYDDTDDCDCDIELPEAEITAKLTTHQGETIGRPEWTNMALAVVLGAAKLFVHDRRFALFTRRCGVYLHQ